MKQYFICYDCGRVAVDDDGCCVHCGADCTTTDGGTPLPGSHPEIQGGEAVTPEEIYDNIISPSILRSGKCCEKHGLSMVAVVEYGKDDRGVTTTIAPEASYAMYLTDLAVRSRGNVDTLIMALCKHARKHGHSSIMLKQLGIPIDPAKEVKP